MDKTNNSCPRPEVHLGIPLESYWYLIFDKTRIERDPTYHNAIKFLLSEMEQHYMNSGQNEVTYTMNPRTLVEEIEKNIGVKDVSVKGLTWAIRAFFEGKHLPEGELEFYTSTTSGGRRNYHAKVQSSTAISKLKQGLFI